ncbi:hypothetical protein PSTG_00342 [Puccinia striiformis f. sp. tritici PST-78]|uniref:Uncharacterized protein n=1 Tax=Puccinia striiformis f. sp. tritici PST-78 TaxID=1165861 RepID=A0A0L0W4S5_9BASI|nr:hypothetical protein PSTG_00342 [Puccinia striiformis f. sp. tritici PST-78]
MNHSYLQFLPRLHVINIVNSSSVNLNPTSKHFWTRTNDDRRSAIEPGNTINTNATFIIFIILTRIGRGHYGNEAEAMEKARELAEKDDIESDVAAMYVEESEDIALFPSSKSQPNGA